MLPMQGTLDEHMERRGERPVLCLRRTEDGAIFRYAVGMSRTPPVYYSVYAEYIRGECHTVGEIPHLSQNRDQAESFCALLEHFLITPLSLEASYEDILTPDLG